jgi:lipopolysaccharide export system permease protein
MISTTFKSWEKRFDLSQFKLNRTDENFFKDLKQMLNLEQLYAEIDTIHLEEQTLKAALHSSLAPYSNFLKFGFDTTGLSASVKAANFNSVHDLVVAYDRATQLQIYERALNKARNIKNFTDVTEKQLVYKERDFVSHMIEVYRKFTLSVACLVLFFIGAPLGSIIRKGGLGWPLFYCVIFFILYHVTSIIGEKLSENNVLTPFGGMWLSTFVLLPLGFFLTMKASSDSKIYSTDYYRNFFRKIFSRKIAAV